MVMNDGKLELIDDLARAFGGNIRELLEKAYSAGFLAGSTQAKVELKSKLNSILSDSVVGFQAPNPPPVATEIVRQVRVKSDNRAPSGSVRPAITEIMTKAGRGVSTEEIFDLLHKSGRADIKRNTVRGTLNIMKAKNLSEKRGGLWFLVDTKNFSGGDIPMDEQEDMLEMSNGPH
jgi:hypothetical protein